MFTWCNTNSCFLIRCVAFYCIYISTHLPLDEMASISQMMFSYGFLLMKSFVFWLTFYYTPVWKTDVLCRGNVRPSVCPSVCPSVRPSVRPRFPDFSSTCNYFCAFWIFRSFPAFFSTCFEISIWNLVYTCSRWCYTSSSSFILIGTFWPTLQPKIGQSHLSAFMALKII